MLQEQQGGTQRDWSGEVWHCTREMLCQILPWSLCFWEKVLKKVQQRWFIFQDSKPVSPNQVPNTGMLGHPMETFPRDLGSSGEHLRGCPTPHLSMFGSYLTKAICGPGPPAAVCVWCVGHQVSVPFPGFFHFFHLVAMVSLSTTRVPMGGSSVITLVGMSLRLPSPMGNRLCPLPTATVLT